jgi:integrase/recombinase XerD
VNSTENLDGALVPVTPTALVATQQAESDQHLIDLWLHGRSRHTQRAYRADAGRFLASVQKPLHHVTLGDLTSVYRTMSAVKSLFAFGHRIGYLPFDVARPLRLPALREKLAERILEETDVLRMIALENMPRSKAILLTLYAGGFRVAELCSLKWGDLQGRDGAGQITVFGKGGKTRTVLVPQSVWNSLLSLLPLAAARPRLTRPGPRRTDPSCAGHVGS